MLTDDLVIKPTSDLFIAKLWSPPENEPILRSLINGVMTDSGLPPITKATVRNPINTQKSPADKQIRLDVRVEDEKGAIYDVEVQTDSHPGFYDRILRYWAELYASQLKRGEDYVQLKPVRSIVITEFLVFSTLQEPHTLFELRAKENPEVVMTQHLQIHFLRLGNLRKNDMRGMEMLPDVLQKWFDFWAFGQEMEEDKMKTMLADSPVLEAYEEYKRYTADPEAREQERLRQENLLEIRLRKSEAWFDGKAEGIAEGTAERSNEIAQNMKAKGLAISLIAEMTGLTESEIENLQ